MMTNRERFVKTLKFEKVDRVPDYEFGVWEQTASRWHGEGLPSSFTGVWGVIPDYFKSEDREKLYLGINTGLLPCFEHKVLEDKEKHYIIQDSDGAICEIMKPEYGASIPKFLRFAIENRRDWEKLRDERLNPSAPGRFPANLEELFKKSRDEEDPVIFTAGSLYGWIRNWMGVENLSYMIYDDPELVEEIMEHLTALTLSILEQLAGKVKIDVAEWWEDMCFRTGPLLSPRHFSQWMVPRYRRVTDFLKKECDCDLNLLDCDGNIHELVPLWLEGGINVMFPLEAAHTDAYRISSEFGSKIGLRGYFDKRALIEGKAAIDREFERILPLFERGGFIPHVDHLVPPDVSFENYCYYRERKCKFIGRKL